ncbi:hypothetical protein [Kribbella sp. NPDC023855]|uniref:hypothetical protein n=1 Tax=Kribbella sp. NPDC023855 TaxID=3154698 RepID=UPI0033F37691
MRRLSVPAALLAATLLLSACGAKESGGMPVPVGSGEPERTITLSGTPSAEPTSAPTKSSGPTKTKAPPATATQVIVVPGNYAGNPAVQGLVTSYPVYFSALVARDADIVKNNFPAYFYADVQERINDAKRNGWVMKPPGSAVVVGTVPQPLDVVRVKLCLSQRTQYWNPKAKTWVVAGPRGVAQAIDMIRTGLGWLPYRLAPATGMKCGKVRFPA